eukprot:COSAG02_NODE_19088_length_900_cov_7.799800_1_plen_40_part_10
MTLAHHCFPTTRSLAVPSRRCDCEGGNLPPIRCELLFEIG